MRKPALGFFVTIATLALAPVCQAQGSLSAVDRVTAGGTLFSYGDANVRFRGPHNKYIPGDAAYASVLPETAEGKEFAIGFRTETGALAYLAYDEMFFRVDDVADPRETPADNSDDVFVQAGQRNAVTFAGLQGIGAGPLYLFSGLYAVVGKMSFRTVDDGQQENISYNFFDFGIPVIAFFGIPGPPFFIGVHYGYFYSLYPYAFRADAHHVGVTISF